MMTRNLHKRMLSGLVGFGLILSLAACAPAQYEVSVGIVPTTPTVEPAATAELSPTLPSATLEPSPTKAPTATPEPSPTEAPTATAKPSPTAEPIATTTQVPATETVQLFLVALEDGGKSGRAIGCGDSIVPVERQVTVTGDPIAAALEALLTLGDRTYGESGLYNALYQSNVHMESVTREGGAVTVQLAGEFLLGGVCDDPRAQAQIEETIRQFPGVETVSVFVNGKPLAQLLSGKG